ncbi:MAG: DUF5667 domain-containing protein [bacterium]|nr:DUF5667 domain-containing protein [bacterium]
MKNPIDQFVEEVSKIRLRDEVKLRIRSKLVAHMLAHPAVLSPYQRLLGILSPYTVMLRRSALALVIFLFVAVGGVTTFAATGSLPGDTLYPIKVKIIEPVRGLMAVSPRAKAEWQVSLAETRVEEVIQLATKEQLTSDEGTQSQARFDRSLKTARETIKKLSQDDPEVATRIETLLTTSLRKHEDDLHEIGELSSSTNAREAHSFAEHVRVKTSLIQTATTTLDFIPRERKNDTKKEQQSSDQPVSSDVTATSSVQVSEDPKVESTTQNESDSGDSLKNSVDDSLHRLRNDLGL